MIELRAHLVAEPEAELAERLERRLDARIAITYGTEPPPQANYDVLISGRPSEALLAASPRLTALLIPYAGLPAKTRELLRRWPQIAVHNLHHNAGPAAELAVALMLAAAKFLVPLDRALRRHDWSPRYAPNPSLLLAGKTALVLGYGAIGHRVARACAGLGMEVIALRRHPRRSPAVARPEPEASPQVHVIGPKQLADSLPRATALIVCLPLTEATEGLVGARELALVRGEAVLVNVGRGPVVAEEALYERLRTGALRAAGLDVWYNYPADPESRTQTPPSRFPFDELENVVLSPHRGGALGMQESERMRMDALAESLNAAVAGRKMPHRVDVEAGY